MQDFIFKLYQWATDHHDKAPMHDNQVHVRGKNSFKHGLATVRGTAQGEDPAKKYFMVQYEGEEAIIVERSELFLIHL